MNASCDASTYAHYMQVLLWDKEELALFVNVLNSLPKQVRLLSSLPAGAAAHCSTAAAELVLRCR